MSKGLLSTTTTTTIADPNVEIKIIKKLISVEKDARTAYGNLRKRLAEAEAIKRKQIASFNNIMLTRKKKKIKRDNHNNYRQHQHRQSPSHDKYTQQQQEKLTLVQNIDRKKSGNYYNGEEKKGADDDEDDTAVDIGGGYREQSVSFLTDREDTVYESQISTTMRDPPPLRLSSSFSEAKKLKRQGRVPTIEYFMRYFDTIINVPYGDFRRPYFGDEYQRGDEKEKKSSPIKYFTADSSSNSRLEPILTNTNLKLASVVKERVQSPVVKKTALSRVRHRKIFLNPIFYTP